MIFNKEVLNIYKYENMVINKYTILYFLFSGVVLNSNLFPDLGEVELPNLFLNCARSTVSIKDLRLCDVAIANFFIVSSSRFNILLLLP